MRIDSLTFFRFVAASIVVIFHYGRDATGLQGILIAGPEMVTFFFVLSGFVMGISYLKKDVKISYYWWARAARILPAYFLALGFVVAYYIIKGIEIDTASLILGMTLMQSWIPPYATTLNGPGWSLSVEAFFYASFPFILRYINKSAQSARNVLIYCFSFWLLIQSISTLILTEGLTFSYPNLKYIVAYFPLTHLCSFTLGIGGAMFFLERRYTLYSENWSLIIFLLSLIMLIGFINNQDLINEKIHLVLPYQSSLFAPLFLLLVLSISGCPSYFKFLNGGIFKLVGEASFSLYILQSPMHIIYTKVVTTNISISPLANFIFFMIFLILISVITFLFFERPMNKYIRYSLPKIFRTREYKLFN